MVAMGRDGAGGAADVGGWCDVSCASAVGAAAGSSACRDSTANFVAYACCRALLSRGSSAEINTAMIPMTTTSSINVNATLRRLRIMWHLAREAVVCTRPDDRGE